MANARDHLVNSTLPNHQRAFVENQNHCPLCQATLEITIETYLEDFTIREEAHCPKCELLARVKDHKMH